MFIFFLVVFGIVLVEIIGCLFIFRSFEIRHWLAFLLAFIFAYPGLAGAGGEMGFIAIPIPLGVAVIFGLLLLIPSGGEGTILGAWDAFFPGVSQGSSDLLLFELVIFITWFICCCVVSFKVINEKKT